jgi:hypothetical protein
MLFGETVAVYCENHMEHTVTVFGRIQILRIVKEGVHRTPVYNE